MIYKFDTILNAIPRESLFSPAILLFDYKIKPQNE
jgi:hypothetical protein